MDDSDAGFLRVVSGVGCEVHRFDPGSSGLAGRHGDRSGGNHSDGGSGVFRQHRVWLDWRATKGRRHQKRGTLGSRSQTLEDIMAALGHHEVHFLYADLLSAEWRVLQNWAELGTLGRVHHLVATVHLQWAGFEVGGTDAEVVRYWFSVLQGLHAAGFRLVRSWPGERQGVLRHHVANVHSSYTLSWVNIRPTH